MLRRIRPLCAVAASATALALISAPSAGAATNLGKTFNPPDPCAPATTYIVTASVGDAYTVPSSGIITGWSFQAAALAPTTAKLKIGRVLPTSVLTDTETDLSVTAESRSENVTPSSLNRYSTRLAVQPGDFLGIYITGEGSVLCSDASMIDGVRDHFNSSDVPAGTSALFERESEGQVEVAAVLEADADHDGFGDESQDQCPANAATQGPCPVTPKKKCKKHKRKHHSAVAAKKKGCHKKKKQH
jgi:hypothetical protein